MATKLAGGSTKNGRDSNPKFLGVKKFGGEKVNVGEIIIRQRGTPFHAGKNVKRTADDTLIAMKSGSIMFSKRNVVVFTGNLKKRRFVSVIND